MDWREHFKEPGRHGVFRVRDGEIVGPAISPEQIASRIESLYTKKRVVAALTLQSDARLSLADTVKIKARDERLRALIVRWRSVGYPKI